MKLGMGREGEKEKRGMKGQGGEVEERRMHGSRDRRGGREDENAGGRIRRAENGVRKKERDCIQREGRRAGKDNVQKEEGVEGITGIVKCFQWKM